MEQNGTYSSLFTVTDYRKSLVPNYMFSILRVKRTSAHFFCSYSKIPFSCILLIKYVDLKK